MTRGRDRGRPGEARSEVSSIVSQVLSPGRPTPPVDGYQRPMAARGEDWETSEAERLLVRLRVAMPSPGHDRGDEVPQSTWLMRAASPAAWCINRRSGRKWLLVRRRFWTSRRRYRNRPYSGWATIRAPSAAAIRPIIDASRIITSRTDRQSAARRSFSLMVPSPHLATSRGSPAATGPRSSRSEEVVYVHHRHHRVYGCLDTVSMERVCDC
jgi:hypothetical protein